MASRLITDLDSCHAYLEKLKGLAVMRATRRYLVNRAKPGKETGQGKALDMVERVSQGPWTRCDKDSVISGINEATLIRGSDGATRCRPKQTMNDIVPYMTQGDIQVLRVRIQSPSSFKCLQIQCSR